MHTSYRIPINIKIVVWTRGVICTTWLKGHSTNSPHHTNGDVMGGGGGLQRYCDITTRSSAVGSPSNNKGLFLSKPPQPSRIPSVLVGWQLSVTAWNTGPKMMSGEDGVRLDGFHDSGRCSGYRKWIWGSKGPDFLSCDVTAFHVKQSLCLLYIYIFVIFFLNQIW